MYIYLFYFLAVVGLRCCVWAFSSFGKPGLLFVLVQEHLTVGGFSSCGAQTLGHEAQQLRFPRL